jgi:hypothetical protein
VGLFGNLQHYDKEQFNMDAINALAVVVCHSFQGIGKPSSGIKINGMEIVFTTEP